VAADGEMLFDGQYVDGVRHGWGEQYVAGGGVLTGSWVEGELCGRAAFLFGGAEGRLCRFGSAIVGTYVHRSHLSALKAGLSALPSRPLTGGGGWTTMGYANTRRWEAGELSEGFYHELYPNNEGHEGRVRMRRDRAAVYEEPEKAVLEALLKLRYEAAGLEKGKAAAAIRHDPSTQHAISYAPLQSEEYETRRVYVAPSTIPGGGEVRQTVCCP